MHTAILQVQPEPWPSGHGEAIAMLDVALDLLADRHGLKFFEGTDNLGDYHAAAIRLPSGRRVGLLRHGGAPYAGVALYADAHDDTQDAVREFLQAAELPETVVSWMRAPAPAHAR